MSQGPIVVDDVLPAIIPIVLVEIPLEWLCVNHAVSLVPASGLGDEYVRKSGIELVGGDVYVVPSEPQPDVPLHRVLLQLTEHHLGGNALVFFIQKPCQQQARVFTAACGEHGEQVERVPLRGVLSECF